MEKRMYGALDILKFIGAIGVVCLHVGLFNSNSSNFEYFIQHSFLMIIVPFFFVCSGFLLGVKLNKCNTKDEGINYIKKYLKRLIIPYIFFMFIGLHMEIYNLRGHDLYYIFTKIIKSVIFYPWGALWYVKALIVATIIIIPFYKKDKIKLAAILGFILYIFALICNNYYFLLPESFIKNSIDWYMNNCVAARNGISVGLYFVSVGIIISKIKIEKQNKKRNLLLLFGIYLLFIIEIFVLKNFEPGKDGNTLYLITTILAPMIVINAVPINIKFNTEKIRNYSTGIYFLHRPVINYTKLFIIKYNLSVNKCFLFGIVLIICFAILTILYKINNKYINKLIK